MEKIVIASLGTASNGIHQFGFRKWQTVVLDCGHRANFVIQCEYDRGRSYPLSVGDVVPRCPKCKSESLYPANPIGFAMTGKLGEAFAGLSFEERGEA
jgi:hypothetical protein